MLSSSSAVRIRKGHPDDGAALAEIFRESWLHTYRSIIPPLHLETMIRRRGADWWSGAIRSGDLVDLLEFDGKPVGYGTYGPSRVRGPYKGEIYELYLIPAYQGLGFGEHLFEGCRAGLDARRLDGLIVWALAANTPAIDFYWRRGGRPHSSTHDRIGRARLEKISLVWP